MASSTSPDDEREMIVLDDTHPPGELEQCIERLQHKLQEKKKSEENKDQNDF